MTLGDRFWSFIQNLSNIFIQQIDSLKNENNSLKAYSFKTNDNHTSKWKLDYHRRLSRSHLGYPRSLLSKVNISVADSTVFHLNYRQSSNIQVLVAFTNIFFSLSLKKWKLFQFWHYCCLCRILFSAWRGLVSKALAINVSNISSL